uniref:Otogelin n=1 Tax=Cynoglossus semilaevis TaxID=244447 RepID=A0A3P8VXA6_CYNSE
MNGGQCVQSESCDCSLYQATGRRCQTVPNPGFEREMTCRSWAQYNFETFDGLYYFFPGRCTYTLLKDCEDTSQANVVVQVHNDPECGSTPYTCQRSVSLFLPWEGEVRLYSNNVTFKGQRLQLPHHIHDLQLEQISQYVLVTQHQGFTLAWDGGSGSVYIKLSPEFVGRTCGMCGNFNADVQDDLKTSYGVLTNEIELFGNSWLETEPHQSQCSTVPPGFSSPCSAVSAQKVKEVCAMLLDPPFQSCHDFVSPLSYMASCSNDLCIGDAVCQVFTEYARACAHADHTLHDWRHHIPQCEKQCPAGLQYRECISCCPDSCSLERTCIDSKLTCLDGCYCPDGLIYEDGRCVTPSDCPCEYHGMFYPSGQTLQEECNNCTCVGGMWNCTDHSCPGECSVTGDMYFQSFDGRLFTFPATCQYVLAKSRNSGRFTITIQNSPCGANLDGACIQSVNLVVDEDPKSEITLSHVGEVFMAGQYRISLPYSDDVFLVQELSSMFLQVKTTFGLRLQYSWKDFRLYLQADERWKDDTVGLCGTFNGNIQDDFLSPSGMIESTPQLFGNAWRVSSACSNSLSSPQLDPCDTHQQAVTYASGMCDILNQDLFSACHEFLSPAPFHQQCRSDTCKCGTPCLCSALAHYARNCRRFSVIVDFRSHVSDCAVTCPANMQYGTCVSSCQSRCSALSVPQHCGEECEEGCVCPQGSFYSHRTHTCVQRSECPCSFLGADYEPGDVIMTSAAYSSLVIPSLSPADRLCPAGQLYQDCSEGEDGFLSGRGVACELTCESYLLNLTCSTHEPCVAGCTCPPGLLRHGDECFEPVACPCLWKGKEYYPGDRVSAPCHDCVCQHGTFQCVFRPCPSMCTAYGDRHYRTFDGLLFDYVGACKVFLVKVFSEGMPLSVTAENINCFESGFICRKSLVVTVGQSSIAIDEDNGNPNPSSVIDKKHRMFIWPAGYFTVIHFPDEDITVLWDRKTTVHVQVGPRWQGKLSGLCGNFDMKTVNEMRTPDNIDSPTSQEFGSSWTAAECVNSADIRHPCSLSPLREPFAKRQCAVLLSEVFQACHLVVDVTWFYMNCLSDTCACSRGGDCECFCTSVAAYAQRCCHQGVPVDWRSPSLCRKSGSRGKERKTKTSLGYFSDSRFDIMSHFMMTPGLSRARPHDTSRLSFEAVDRPNYFLYASPDGQVKLAKWEESEAFWDGATFVLHRNTWIFGYSSLESHAKSGFFLHTMLPRLHLLKYRHTDSFRKATLFRLTGHSEAPPQPLCQWRYESCISPCFKTCSDPWAEACVMEGCIPVCPPHMVLDEVTRRCVHVEDCKCVLRTDTTSSHTEKTSWSTMVPTTNSTTKTTISRSSVFPEVFTTTKGLPVTTELRERPEAHTETTREPHTPSTERITHATSTTPSEHWRTTPQVTTSTPVHRPTVTMKEEEVTSTETTKVPKLSHPTTEKTVTSVTSQASTHYTTHTETSSETSAVEIVATTTTAWVIPPTTIPSAPKTTHTTATTRPSSGVITTIRPVVIQPVTETIHPLTGRVQMSTTTTTIPPTTTTSAILKPTSPERVTTRLVSTIRATPSTTTTTTKPTTTLRTTPSLPVTTRVTPRTPVTERSTIKPLTTRVTEATRTPVVPTRSTSPQPPTVTPSPGTTTVAVTVPTSTVSVTTTSTAEPADDITTAPVLTTVPAVVPVPTLTTAASSTPTPTHASRGTVSSVRPTTSTDTDMSPSASHLTTPTPEGIITTTHEHRTPSSSTIPGTMTTTTTRITEPHGVNHTSPDATLPSKTTTSHALPETTRHTDKDTTSIPVAPTGICSVGSPPYAEIVDECTKYICVNNQLILFNKSQSCPFTSEPPNCGLLGLAVQVNGDKCCPQWDCPCRCSMFPDLSLITFDGNSVAVYKAASYIVMQLPNETISVLVQECPADSESPIIWNFTNLCLVALNITHQSNSIVINRLQRRLYVNTRYAKPRFKKYGFEIYDTGNMYLIRSPAGLGLQWYHSTGMMIIETDNYSNKLSTLGLCGVCDGDPSNDLTLANGTTVGVGEDPALFIDSWQVPNTTSYISQSRRRELNCSTSDCSSCMAMLQNPAFHPCHEFVSPDTFCEIWIKDAEYVNNQCVALAAYVASCHKFNICIEWRRPDYCPFVCPDALRYQACLPACTSQSCTNHDFDSDPEKCSGLTEGCVCPEGTLLHRPYSALCISPEKCACTDGSGIPHANGEVWKASKDACCMYRCENDTIIPLEYNCSSVAAPVCHRAGQTVISLTLFVLTVCNQSLCDPSPPVCKYGEKLVSYYRQDSCCPYFVCECDSELCESAVPTCREDQTLISTRADNSCCLAHICMCASSCPQTPPLCQEGEVLTIDRNSTDRCCPIYQCVCERYRCSQPSCPVGMSVASVAVPGRCCPNQTCVCTYDTRYDSTPTSCSGCVFSVPEAVCVFGERGVLRPGQTLVEHGDDGLCHSRQCSRSLDPASGFHLLRTSSMNCSTHCLPNQIYIPPRDQSTCCGVCKNISCIYEHENGTAALYKPGRSWVSNCMKFDCADTLSGATLISYPFSCPPFNETECMKIGGSVVSYMDGCCKTCKEDGKSCQKVTVRMTIRKNDCRSNRPVNIVSCDGKCPSASIYNYNINTYARFCKCCRETGLQRRSVQLYCSSNSTWVSYSIQEPTDCSCQWS